MSFKSHFNFKRLFKKLTEINRSIIVTDEIIGDMLLNHRHSGGFFSSKKQITKSSHKYNSTEKYVILRSFHEI